MPDLKGRVINQDLPHVVTNTIDHPGVEKSAHDFWKPQIIKREILIHNQTIASADIAQMPKSTT